MQFRVYSLLDVSKEISIVKSEPFVYFANSADRSDWCWLLLLLVTRSQNAEVKYFYPYPEYPDPPQILYT